MGAGRDGLTIAQSGQLDALVALVRIGMRLTFSRNDEICAEGGSLDCWYKVVSGTVRVCKLLEDGRRHIGEFCFSGDCFGIDSSGEQLYSAEAVDDVIVTRQLDDNPLHRLLDGSRLSRVSRWLDSARGHRQLDGPCSACADTTG
jgi:CRP-like cAMP-binding protein